jgi:hypothetical protein
MPQQSTPSVQLQTPAVNTPSRTRVPFRAATLERVDILAGESLAMTASTQRIERTLEGAGYVFGIYLDVVATSATSTAASVAVYAEDAPFNVLDSVIFRDVNGEICNLQGFNLWLTNLINGYNKLTPPTANAPGSGLPSSTGVGGIGTSASQDANLVVNVGAVGTASTGATAGGNFRFPVRVPVATNRRDLLGILANQDRAQKYSLRTDVAASGSVFGTAPSSLPTIAINKFYEQYSVPLPTAPDGSPQDIFPAHFGTVHFHTQTVSESAPSQGSTVNHYVRRIGNTVRWFGLVARSATSSSAAPIRGNADVNPPNLLRLKLGEDSVYSESYNYRRGIMFERYGFDLPRALMLYDFIHDFGPFSGFELGDDLVHSQALVNAQFQITYPSGGSVWQAGSTLTILTSDLIFSEPQVASVR